MKAIFALFMLIVVLLAMVEAGVHHYTVKEGGSDHGHGHGHKDGTIFDTAASLINGVI